MHRQEIVEALAKLRLVVGGTIEGLLMTAEQVQNDLQSAVAEIALGNEKSFNVGRLRFQQSLSPLAERVAKVSPSGTAIELRDLASKFDSVLEEYPALEDVLRPGRQALAGLAGAFDVVLQQHSRPSALFGLVGPAVRLADNYEHYAALVNTFILEANEKDQEKQGAGFNLEIAGADDLVVFAEWINLLSSLARVAGRANTVSLDDEGAVPDLIWIANIESGSPIRIDLRGSAKAIELMMAMLRDLFRTLYQSLTIHGRVYQAMETLSRARELGIDSPAVLSALNAAVVQAAFDYKEKIGGQVSEVSVNGTKMIEEENALLVHMQDTEEDQARGVQRLLPPTEE